MKMIVIPRVRKKNTYKKYNFNIFVEKKESCRAYRYVLSEQRTKQNSTFKKI